MIQAGDRGGVGDFSFFEKLIIIILLSKVGFIKLGSADTGYVLTRREARAVGSFKTPISKVVLTTTIAAEVVATVCYVQTPRIVGNCYSTAVRL